jgi:hypothetical protein
MSSSAKRRQTIAKRNREQAVKERRAKKHEKKEAKKQAAAEATALGLDGSPDGDAATGPFAALLAQLELSAGEAETLSDAEIVMRAVDVGISRLTAERMIELGRGDDPARARPHGQSRPWTSRGS